MSKQTKETAEQAYTRAYNTAMANLKKIEEMIHDMPAPGGETKINWGNHGDMAKIAAELGDILVLK
jgi:hypothetical protein